MVEPAEGMQEQKNPAVRSQSETAGPEQRRGRWLERSVPYKKG